LPSVTTANEGRQPSWFSNRCNLMAPLRWQYLALSNMVADNSMKLPSRLIGFFLKRNLRRVPVTASARHVSRNCVKIDS